MTPSIISVRLTISVGLDFYSYQSSRKYLTRGFVCQLLWFEEYNFLYLSKGISAHGEKSGNGKLVTPRNEQVQHVNCHTSYSLGTLSMSVVENVYTK